MKPVPALEGFTAYHVPGKRCPIDVRLDGNEGAQPSREVLAALSEPTPDLLRRYPDAALLESRIAARHGVDSDRVMVTAGADEALDRACRALLGPGRELIMPVPTFEMLGKYARLVGADVRTVAWPQGDYPIEAVLAAITPSTAAIAVVSPNNPTGAVARPADVERLCAAAPHAAVFVDGAYEEFADAPLADVALRHRNALLFKTLSKAWGVAGLRVGYVIGTPEAIGWIRCAGSPYSVSGPSLLLAERLLQDGDAPVERFVTRVRGERAALSTLLSDLGAEVLPSQANFVMVRHPRWRHIWEGLAGLGVAVRAFPDRPHLERALRITVPGREDWYARLEAGLRAVLHPQALLFDMDGVLADVSGSYNAAIVQTAAHFGAPVTHTDVAEMKARGDANNDWIVTRRLLAERGIDVVVAPTIQARSTPRRC
ncbi:MAG: aminotransferase class I/II-fold pyridoxal phosphate-dependent enzyme, partial [Proteobacteria bacterium]|nr:aminotransferase class I/II-fold pyridoxal phosphate-dependent enzyme [Pseudomonadota bacterium]